MTLNALNEGECIADFVGPLGNPTEVEGIKKACVVGGGVGCAIALPVVRELHEMGCEVTSPSSASEARISSFWRTNSAPLPTSS